MKFATSSTIFNRKSNEKDLIKHSMKSKEFWEKECKDHPTNNSCLLYCD